MGSTSKAGAPWSLGRRMRGGSDGTGYVAGPLHPQSEANDFPFLNLQATLERALLDQDRINAQIATRFAFSGIEPGDECAAEWERTDGVLTATLGQLTNTSARSIPAAGRKLQCYHRAVSLLGLEDPRVSYLASSLLAELSVLLPVAEIVQEDRIEGDGVSTSDRQTNRGELPRRPISIPRPDFANFLGWSRRSQPPE
jgi:hypothetical protein